MDVNYNPCYQKMRIWKTVGGVVDWHQCQIKNKRSNHLACRKCMMRIIITVEKPLTIYTDFKPTILKPINTKWPYSANNIYRQLMYNKYNYQQVQTTIQKLKLKTISNDRNISKLGSQNRRNRINTVIHKMILIENTDHNNKYKLEQQI